MDRVVKDSDFITLILITDGSQNIQGTPFDGRINELFRLWHSEQEKARRPFLTVLRAKSGKITDVSVTPAPWPVEFPPLPAELLAAEVQPPKPVPPPKQETRPPLPPIILIGKKPEPTPQPTPSEVVTPQPAPVSNSTPAQVAGKSSAPAPPPAPTTAAGSKETEPVRAEPLEVSPKPPPAARAPIFDQAKAELAPSPPPNSAEPPAAAKLATPVARAPMPGDLKSGGTAVAPRTESSRTAGAFTVAAAESPAPNPQPADGNAQPKTSPAQIAVATLRKSVFSLAGMLLAGLAFSAIVLAGWYVLARGSRTSTHASLITRSMDHKKK